MSYFSEEFVSCFSYSAISICWLFFVFLFSLQMNGPGSLFTSESFLGISSHPRNDFGNFFGSAVTKPPSSVTLRHPLEGTHELRQACQICFVKSGQDQYKVVDSIELVTWEFLVICKYMWQTPAMVTFSIPVWILSKQATAIDLGPLESN